MTHIFPEPQDARDQHPEFQPILPRLSRSIPRGREWLYEVKLDGFRGMLHVARERARFTSKTCRAMPRFDALAASLAPHLRAHEAVLDGEIVVMRDGRPDFASLFFRREPPAYAAFDLLWLDGRDLRSWPTWRRKAVLQKLIDGTPIGFVDAHDDPELMDRVVALDMEGIVAKRRSDDYSAMAAWVKVKHPHYSQAVGRWKLFTR